jgi:hypothetical protein
MTSETGTDNIEDYAEQAEASKDAAAASETASANSAAASASSASGSSTSAAEALASKNAAAVSETNAASSAATATTQASNSSTSATASETSRVASVAAQAAAETAETAAETAQAAAEAAEAGVAADAATATAQAAIATTQATNSGTSATASEASRVAAVAAQAAAETAETNAEAAETNAETAQAAAETAETNAASSSASASTSAATATTQAGIATTKASEAAASATASASSATASEAAKDAALSALDNFQDQYLGDFATDPTTDNDGDPLQAGMLYFNTTDDVMKVYTGSAWVAAYASLSGALLTTNNLSDLVNAATARTNLGLGTAATTASTDYATAAQGTLADSAVQPSDSPTFGSVTVTGTVDGRDVAADGTKLDGIEAGATADQTAAEIRALVESATDSNVFTDADHTKLNGIAAGATNVTNNNQLTNGAGYTTNVGDITGVTAGTDLTGGGSSGAITINHADTSTLSGNYGSTSNGTKIDTISVDARGHVTAITTGSTGDIEGVTAGTNLNGGGTSGTVTLNVDSSPSFTNVTATGDVYVGDQIFHNGDTDTYMQFGTNQWNVYVGGSREITVDTTGVRLGDTGNGYFQPVSGDYGSIQIDGGAHGGYEGYSIGGRVVLMHDNSVTMGLYNDVNNEWLFRADLNGSTRLYNNGTEKVRIDATYMEMSQHLDLNNYDIYGIDQIFHHGDTNTYMQFHAADQWRVVTGGAERLEVNNSDVTIHSALKEDYDALSGTTPTIDVDAGGAFSLTMTGNTTFTFSSCTSGVGVGFVLQITGNGSTLTWPSSVDWAGGTAPDAPASGASNLYVFYTRDGGSNWVGVLSSAAYA